MLEDESTSSQSARSSHIFDNSGGRKLHRAWKLYRASWCMQMPVAGETHEQQEVAQHPEAQSGRVSDSEQEASAAAYPATVLESRQASDPGQEASAAAHPASVRSSEQASDSEPEAHTASQPASVLASGSARDSEQEAYAAVHPASVPTSGRPRDSGRDTHAAVSSASVQSVAARLQEGIRAVRAAKAPENAASSAPREQSQKAAKQEDFSSKALSVEVHAPSAAAQAEEHPASQSGMSALASVSQKSAKVSYLYVCSKLPRPSCPGFASRDPPHNIALTACAHLGICNFCGMSCILLVWHD